MPNRPAALHALTIALALTPLAHADDPATDDLVSAIKSAIIENYIFPDVAQQTADLLDDKLTSGAYEGLYDAELAEALTADLQSLSKDRHFRVVHNPPAMAHFHPGDPGYDHDAVVAQAAKTNFGFRSVQILQGNIGYLKLNGFSGLEESKPKAHAAMAFLADTNALILDLTENGGGDPMMVQLVCSYFFPAEPPTHLNSLYYRPDDHTEEYWTLTELPNKRMPDTPLYVLTSPNTFSAAEECAYNVHTRHRATIVGQVSGGGAHPGDLVELPNNYGMFLPTGRAINPVTGANWEGTGVPVDVECPADEALDRAHLLALEGALESMPEPMRETIAWAIDLKRASLRPSDLDAESLAQYTGDFTNRAFVARGNELWYSRADIDNKNWRRLLHIEADTFMIEDVDYFKLTFERDNNGKITGVRATYADGQLERSPKSAATTE